MDELKNNIILTLVEIEQVSDYLYQQKTSKAYEGLNNTLGKIMGITDRLLALSNVGKLRFDGQRLIDNLTLAMNAMEEKDSVLLADILVFEIAAQLQELILE